MGEGCIWASIPFPFDEGFLLLVRQQGGTNEKAPCDVGSAKICLSKLFFYVYDQPHILRMIKYFGGSMVIGLLSLTRLAFRFDPLS